MGRSSDHKSRWRKFGRNKHKQTRKNRTMKTKCLRACILSMAAGGLVLVSGCAVDSNGHMVFVPPAIQVVAPAPVVVAPPVVEVAPPVVEVAPPVIEATVTVPDTYVWDGYENVGIVNGQYYYLGPDNVWLIADRDRLERFHGWERGHPDWRDHAIRNDRFRRDAHGREQPRHDERGKAEPKKKEDKK